MKVKDIAIDKIELYKNNPRLNDEAVPALMKSIQEFGFKVPVIVDKDMVCICGHTRIKAARNLGMTKIPCVVADDLTPEQVKAFRLADNQVSTLAGWDFPKLDIEVIELKEIGWDMTQFGFMDIDVEEPAGDPGDDQVPDMAMEGGPTFGEDDMEVPMVVMCFNRADAEDFKQRMMDEGRTCRPLH